jgi:glucokinase
MAESVTMILAGDLGGTKSNLGIFEVRQGRLEMLLSRRYPSHDYATAEEVIGAFAREAPGKISAACFGVAGPVVENTVKATNLAWVVDGAKLASLLQLERVTILNDLEATAYGLRVLPPTDFVSLRDGVAAAHANQALIAAGTGLGEAILFWDGTRHLPMATEGGHADYAPHTDEEILLMQSLKKTMDRVEVETIISGRGFPEIHRFLDPSVTHASFGDAKQDPSPEITANALAGSCAVCVRTVEMWMGIYGAEAGNLALRAVARGGIYVAGGIAVKILPMMKDGRFADAFTDKGKLRGFLASIPISIVLNENAPLLGAAYVASQAG